MTLESRNAAAAPVQTEWDACASEPIHTPGLIQTGGCLITFDTATGAVLQASANVADWLPGFKADATATALPDLIGAQVHGDILAALANARPGTVHCGVFTVPADPAAGILQPLELVVHRHLDIGFVEIFAAQPANKARDWMQLFTDTLDTLRPLTGLQPFVEAVAQRIKDVTGFDRVMVYRFGQDGHGHVMAEAREPAMESLLDLHYPASDIPAQARALYRTSVVRYIADVDYQPVPVLSHGARGSREASQPLDMSHAQLRSASPVHLQYLRNMGVQATLTLSLLVDGKLWGLVACHHRTRADVSNQLLRAMHPFAGIAGLMLSWVLQRQQRNAAAAVELFKREIVEAFSDVGASLEEVVARCTPALLHVVSATGGVLWRGNSCTPFGTLTDGLGASVVSAARQRLAGQAADVADTADTIWTADAPSEDTQAVCGLLALRFDPAGDAGIAWVRPPMRLQTAWGGDPAKPVLMALDAQGRPVLQPRTSFARWVTVTEGRCRPWSTMDVDAALGLSELRQLLSVRHEVAQLAHSDRQLRGLLALQAQVLWTADASGRLLALSAPLLMGANPGSAAHFVDDLLPWYDVASLSALRRAMDGGQPFRDLPLVGLALTDAAQSQLAIDGHPDMDGGGLVVGWHGTLRDVAQLRRAAAAAHQQEVRRLAEVERLRFLRSVGHEMRNPLHAVQGFTYLLLNDGSLQPQARHRLERIKTAGDTMLGMVEDLMDMARLQSEAVAMKKEAVDACAVVMAAVDAATPAAAERGVRITVDAPAPVWTRGDAAQLRRVVDKLASNAIKYNRRDGAVHVQVGSDMHTGRVRIAVRDTGDGLSQAQMARLFQPFDRLGREGMNIEGMGLGLSIAQRLLHAMDGQLHVVSEPGTGSCFSVELPPAADPSTAGPSTDPPAQDQAAA